MLGIVTYDANLLIVRPRGDRQASSGAQQQAAVRDGEQSPGARLWRRGDEASGSG